MSLQGFHVAVHTDQVLLSTGSWMDFSQHVHMLLLDGKDEEARTLWDSVFEVVHMGVDPSTPVLQSPDMPPIRRMPYCKTPCARCEGSSSRSLGHGPAEPSSLKKGIRWHPPGIVTMPILTRLWTLSPSKCMPLGTASKTSSLSMWPSSRIGWLVETMGSHRATSLPCGVCGSTGQLCGMSQFSSCQTSRALTTRLGDSYGCCWVRKRQKGSSFHPYYVWSATIPGSWSARAVGLTGVTTAGTTCPSAPCVGTALMEKHEHLVALGIAAYNGRGIARGSWKHYQGPGETCASGSCGTPGETGVLAVLTQGRDAPCPHKTARTTLPPPLPEAVYSLGSLREVPCEHPHRQRGQYVYPLCPQARAESPQGVELTRHHDRQVRSHCMVFTFLFSVPRAGTSQHFAAVIHGFLVFDTSKSGSFYRTIGMSA